jgi:cytochrome c556
MHRKVVSAAAALFVFLSLLATAVAETKPENAIKYRHAVMEAMGGHMEALALIAFNLVQTTDDKILENHAESLANLSDELLMIFPEGSGVGETEALPKIWAEPEKFTESVEAAVQAIAILEDAVESGDRKAITGAFRKAGEGCKGCHENFREEHDRDEH